MSAVYPGLVDGDVVRILQPMHDKVYDHDGAGFGGTCLSENLPTEVDIPVGTQARVERGEGRWGEDMLVLHFLLPGLPEFSISWGMERWPHLMRVRDGRVYGD
jgi:hypothetical protein